MEVQQEKHKAVRDGIESGTGTGTNTESKNGKIETAQAENVLPKAGKEHIIYIAIMVTICGVAIVSYLGYKKYRYV